jgi:predicted XRE-type DNA-binding protein
MSEKLEMTRVSGNIFAALDFDEQEAANLLIRSQLMNRLIAYIEEEDLTQEQAAKRLGVHQPRISQLMRGKIGSFSIDALVAMLSQAGIHLRIEFEQAA